MPVEETKKVVKGAWSFATAVSPFALGVVGIGLIVNPALLPVVASTVTSGLGGISSGAQYVTSFLPAAETVAQSVATTVEATTNALPVPGVA